MRELQLVRIARKFSTVLAFCLVSFQLQATHIVGGDISVKWMSGNDFQVTLTFFRDCGPTSANFDTMVELGVYDKALDTMQQSFVLPLSIRDTLQLGDTCFTPIHLCIEKGVYQGIVTIPDNAHGYYIAWQRCCRNHIILNIQDPGSAGMVFYTEIPDPSMQDNSPVFGSYPNAYMCSNQLNFKSFVCNDTDGDSLVYSLVTPMNGFTSQSAVGQYPFQVVLDPGPYPAILWQSPYDSTDMMGGIPPMMIDSLTGIITAQPANIGVYVFAVRVEEFRNGIKIGEIRRDIQYQVVNCPTFSPPVFSSPVTTTFTNPSSTISYELIAGDSLSFDVTVTNSSQADSVFLYGPSQLYYLQSEGMNITFRNDSSPGTVRQSFYLETSCDAIFNSPYHLKFYGLKYPCYGTMETAFDAVVYVRSPWDGSMDSLVPNVFTPNGDGKNDFFHINATPNYCFDNFKVKIYNRWGTLVFESEDFHFEWDGKDKGGNRLSEGTFYFILIASFKEHSFNKKGAIELRR